jgi:WD40 repeat protein
MDPNPGRPARVLRGPEPPFRFDSTGTRWIGSSTRKIWDIGGPPDADPLVIEEPPASELWRRLIHPNGSWRVATANDRLFFRPVGGAFPYVLSGHTSGVRTLEFTGDGMRLVSGSDDQTVRLWPLSSDGGDVARVLWRRDALTGFSSSALDPLGRYILVSTYFYDGVAFLAPISGGRSDPENLWPATGSRVLPVAFSSDGRLAAAGVLGDLSGEDVVIRVWDLESRDEQVLELREGDAADELDGFDRGVVRLEFTPEGDLLSAGLGGVRRWKFDTGEGQWLVRTPEEVMVFMDASRDGLYLLTVELPTVSSPHGSNLRLHDVHRGSSQPIDTHGRRIARVAIDSAGAIVATGSSDGVIRVGPAGGDEPHLLLGHEGAVSAVAISPDSRWIASGGQDSTIRLWPMPDVSKPPLHTLPREELIAKLKTLTNLRVVRDEESPTGWGLEIGPFPGWATVPEW